MKNMPFIKSSLTMLALALMAIFSNAQQFPSKPINLVVPFVPGGGTDSIARDIAKLLSEKLDQPVIVENKGGAVEPWVQTMSPKHPQMVIPCCLPPPLL